MVAEGSGGGGGHAPRHARHGSRGARLSSEDEEEEEAASDGSEDLSEEEGSGGTPQRPSWAARGAARSTRRPGLRGSVPAPARVASAPDLRAAQQQSASPPAQQVQQAAQAAQAAQQPSGPGFVALPGGGLQLQFGGSVGAPAGPAAGLFGAPSPASQPAELQAAPLQLPGTAPGAAQPLLVRVGSETHLIPHQQQQPAPPAGAAGAAGSTLGKRMSRIQSEPSFACECAVLRRLVLLGGRGWGLGKGAGRTGRYVRSSTGWAERGAAKQVDVSCVPHTVVRAAPHPLLAPLPGCPAVVKEEPSGSLGGDLGDLMNDRDLFKAFDLGPVSVSELDWQLQN